MGCGALRASKTHPASFTPESGLSVVPDSASKESGPVGGEDTKADEIALATDEEEVNDDDDEDDEDDDEESDESMPGEPMEAQWARAAKRKKKLSRQRRRAAKAAKEGNTLPTTTAVISRFTGFRRPCANPEKEGCFDRQCFLSSSQGAVEEIYDVNINLGKGTFGYVERCTHRKTKKLRAVKTIPKKKVYHPERLAHEVEVMRMLEHPNILKLYGTFEDDKYIYIVMELCNGGELLERVTSLNGGGLSERAVAKVMKQVVGAVYYMHQQRICHRDLKPENFLLLGEVEDVADAHVKVIDFGFSTCFEPGGFMSTRACTNNYVAPEVLDGRYTEACDIWSLGVTIYVLLSGQKPFWGANEAEMMAKVKICAYDFEDPPCWSSVSDDAKDLIRRILVLDFTERLTAEKMLQHCWLTQLAPKASFEALPEEVLARLRSFNSLGKFKRAAMTALVQQLQEESILQLREIFQALDEDGDGSLSVSEVERGLKQAGIEFTSDAQHFLQHVDSDGSGLVEYTEFLAAAIDEKHSLQEAACWEAFRVFDIDGDGKITKDEIAMLLSCGRAGSLAESLGADRAEIEQAVAEADLDGDERLDFEEFRALLQCSCARKPAGVALPNSIGA